MGPTATAWAAGWLLALATPEPATAGADGGVGPASRTANRQARIEQAEGLTQEGNALWQQQKLAEQDGGRFVDKTHFVVAGGQVKSMLSWLGYMKHGEPQERVFGLKMPPPNLKPDYEEQAKSFVDDVLDSTLPRSESDDGAHDPA